ncbi:hypothetical protein BXU11_06230 [Flavobacterium sp. LM5]|uniref:P-loop ATPase, Sll1717 family n=1 Tax=Flavobacterium sp. LM5 TaxID=1938610 RepID=UPI000991EC4B|nr:hypothetical protein [Flavobacterium sp. LM5]OOV29480.1 hypothetical protein BXU11_06230 [Flavobacterium sp. LM5]
MDKYNKAIPEFDLKKIGCINFGNLEGEKDTKLSNSFFITDSILNLIQGRFNYVLSPKGGGKSAVFRALNEKLLDFSDFFEYHKYSIVPINNAFVFETDYLPTEKFKIEDNRKTYTLSWALYFLTELINDIKTNHSDKQNYGTFIKKVARVEELKENFRLYNIVDIINNFNLGLTFSVSGLPIEMSPTIKITEKKDRLVLNNLFVEINKFYKENNLTSLILIDRLDNFVRKEAYHIQKNYIQGLIDCIEEISILENINPILFIRTDLFYAYDIDFEYDKVKERTIELNWSEDETLNFIVYRLLSNNYIHHNYGEYFHFVIEEGFSGKHRHTKNDINGLWKKFKNLFKNDEVKYDLKRTLGYTIAEKFIRLFFPKTIGESNTDFCVWITESLKDSNSFVNPRVVIYFFNQLFELQKQFYKDNPIDVDVKLKALNNTDEYHFDIFKQEVIEQVYNKVKNDELRNILKILKNSNSQSIFKEINLRTLNKSRFFYGDINVKKLGVQKEEYDRVLKYLSLLGYCKEVEKQIYEIPKIYRYEMTLQTIE